MELPRKIYETATERYFDFQTGNHVAIKKIKYKGKLRDIVIAYEETKDVAYIITIHPLKPDQKQARIISGRWKPL